MIVVSTAVMMLIIFATCAVLFALAERLMPLRAKPLFRRGFFADAAYVGIHYVLRVVINGTVAVAVAAAGRRMLPPGVIGVMSERPVWMQAIVLLVVLDIFFYVMHRLKHRWTWWWRLHETHHSSTDLDWLSTARFHPIEKVLDRVIYLLPLTVIGASDTAVLIWASVDAFFGMFIHANVTWRLGPLIYVFMGPEMHRWHHSLDRDHRDSNFGNNFSFLDWIFGTAYLSRDMPTEFGVDDPAYPVENLARQFTYAFRRRTPAPPQAIDAAIGLREQPAAAARPVHAPES
jgi:sterol desaturase/sphingolipid hydroxylase (fatty acid hydroxylase superfamily)